MLSLAIAPLFPAKNKLTSFVCVILATIGLDPSLQAQTNVFPATGSVGIGTTSPQWKLDVRGIVMIGGADFILGKYDNRDQGEKTSNRAFVHNNYNGLLDCLIMNWDGDFEGGVIVQGPQMTINGNVGIGTTSPTHKLTVNGPIRAKEIIVDTGWADHVFADSYQLPPLSEVEAHIKEHKHLPGIPSAATVATEGVSLGEMQTTLLAKIEELTLHLIEQNKKVIDLSQKVSAQAAEMEKLKAENALLKR